MKNQRLHGIWRFISLWAIIGGLAGFVPLFAQAYVEQNLVSPSAQFRSSVGRPIPNVALPEHIVAPEGKLTFFADFNALIEKGVPIYVVNRTGQPVSFDSQDGDIYLKLERQREDGSWERAQAHVSSDCGNSYGCVTLQPGQHFTFYGYLPRQGEKARVRFARFGDSTLVSNEDNGWVLPADISEARIDSLARKIPSPLARILETSRYARESVSPESQVAALRLLQSYEDNLYYRNAAEKAAKQWEEKQSSTDEEKKAARAIRKVLAQPWPKKRDADALRQRCLSALEHLQDSNSHEFGMPEADPTLLWSVLYSLALAESGVYLGAPRDSSTLNIQNWKPAIDHAVKQSFTGKDSRGLSVAIRIAAIPRIADELLADSFFERHLLNADPDIQRVCARTLSRRMQWRQLANLSWNLPPQGQIIVLHALAYPDADDRFSGERSRDPAFGGEVEFWEYCIKTQPLEAAYALYAGHRGDYNSFNRVVHDPLREYLSTEAEKGRAATEDFDLGQQLYSLPTAVEFLAAWNLEEDTPVFQKLLGYRGYYEQRGIRGDVNKSYIMRRYTVREAAKRALLKRGIPVPENVLLEKDVTPQ